MNCRVEENGSLCNIATQQDESFFTPLKKIIIKNDLNLFVKCEFLNPTGSIDDRAASHIQKELERRRLLTSETTLVISTTGNLGISLASKLNHTGVKLICVIPESTTSDRIQLLKVLGSEIIRSTVGAHPEASESCISIAKKIASETSHSVLIDENSFRDQFEAAMVDLANEIIAQSSQPPEYIFIGLENEVSFIALSKQFKSKIPQVKIIVIEPVGSSALEDIAEERFRKKWLVEELGSHFKLNIDKTLYDDSCKIPDAASFSTSRKLARSFGILAGPSSGAVIASVLQMNLPSQARVVAILKDNIRNYSSTVFSNSWLAENNLLDEELEAQFKHENFSKFRGASIEDLQLPAAVTISSKAHVDEALHLMLERDYSQLPVLGAKRNLIGFVSLGHLEQLISKHEVVGSTLLDDVIFRFSSETHRRPYQLLTPETPLTELSSFFESYSVGFVTDEARQWCLAVVTKFDLLSFLTKRNF